MNPNQLKSLSGRQQGARVSAVKMAQSNPTVAAAVSKMVSGTHTPQHDEKGRRKIAAPDYFHMTGVSSEMSSSITDNENLLRMLPDLELAAQILVSSVLSPKDMMDAKLNYVPPEGLLTASTNSAMINSIRTHFTQVYNIKQMLPKMLRRALVEAGCFPTAVIPESSIDYLINKDIVPDLQSYKALTREIFEENGDVRSLGILGPSDKAMTSGLEKGLGMESFFGEAVKPSDMKVSFAFEEYANEAPVGVERNPSVPSKLDAQAIDPYITFTDNPGVLKIPALADKMAKYRASQLLKTRSRMSVGAESFLRKDKSNLSEQDMYGLIARTPGGRSRQVNSLTPQSRLGRKTIGSPLIMELPPESVIPVFSPGQVEVHAGYYIVIDMTGNPISRSSNPQFQDYLGQQFSQPGNAQHRLINQAHMAFAGMNCTSQNYIDYATRVYGDMIEAEMIARCKNGLYKGGVSIARNDDIYRLMIARTLRAQHTQLLFVPAEMMTYFALDYNENGTGRSIMDDLKTINAMRAIMNTASVMGSVRNSIGRTVVDIQLDPESPDPYKDREKAMFAFAQGRSSMLPLHLNRPMDIVGTLQQAGVEFNTSGSDKIPDMKIAVTETNSQVQKPDQDLDDNLRRMSFMRFGLSPETVDNGFTGDFATSVVANNILLSRRVRQTQEQIVPQVTDHVRKVIRATEYLHEELLSIVTDNYETIQLDEEDRAALTVKNNEGKTDEAATKAAIVDYVVQSFIDELQCELPSPDTTTVENQYASFQAWKDLFEEILDAHITSDLFDEDLDGDVLKNQIDRLKAIVRNFHIRKWCVDNGVLSELTSITAKDADGKPMVNLAEEHSNFVKDIASLLGNIIKKTEGLGQSLDAVAAGAKAIGSTDDSSSSYSSTDSSSTDDGESGESGGDGGLDDLGGLGDDLLDPAGPADAT